MIPPGNFKQPHGNFYVSCIAILRTPSKLSLSFFFFIFKRFWWCCEACGTQAHQCTDARDRPQGSGLTLGRPGCRGQRPSHISMSQRDRCLRLSGPPFPVAACPSPSHIPLTPFLPTWPSITRPRTEPLKSRWEENRMPSAVHP